MSEPNGVQDHQVQDHEAQNHEDQSPPVRSPKGEVEGTHIQQSSDSSSDKETDTFEDAVDTGSIRSLTKRNTSTAAVQQIENGLSDAEDDGPPKPPSSESPKEDQTPQQPDQPDKPDHQADPSNRDSNQSHQSDHSVASLDNVNLDDDSVGPQKEKSSGSSSAKTASRTISLSSITHALPSMPWSPPATTNSTSVDSTSTSSKPPAASPPPQPAAAAAAPAPAAAPPSRKLTSAFSWLSRNPSKERSSSSPPPAISPRRNTASSIATLTSNPEMMLSRLEEEKEGADAGGNPPRNSLKDRFKLLRMREEAGIVLPELEDGNLNNNNASTNGGSPTGSLGVPNSAGLPEEKDSSAAAAAAAANQPPTSPVPPSPNPNLAPGTASGVMAGPSEMADAPVDWDLWQAVVYEGPAAVARTSAEELNKAIATGIPHAIRGVIWQVLAQSKNDGLEIVYRDLVARGTEKDKNRNSSGTTSIVSNGNLSAANKEPVSSTSSIHSDHSHANGSPSPTEKDTEAMLKAQAAAAAERKKKQKEDTAKIQKLEKSIRRDLGARTSYSKFAAAQGLQEGLFGVCKAYALFDEAVSYAQGMNFLVMPLLFNMPEDEAFCLLVRLMNHYHLRDLFIQDMPGLHKHLYLFERLLEDVEPALYCHLHRRGISPHLYATQWFLTLFSYRFPLQLVLRIYDLIFSEGLSAVLRFGIVLMQKNAATLLGMSDMAQLSTFLKDRVFDVYIDSSPSSNSILENGFFGSSTSSIDKEVYRADQLVRDACEVKVTPEVLKAYTAEWEEKTRAEKEREAELQELRSANTNFAVKVRRLEERIEAVDHEQAALATELVHTKVKNEEITDENESLRGQVQELRVVIEKQPEEIEGSWKLERDDLMKRNAKVHEENQKLEKELAELEEELVQTKMQYAEINSQHEALTRRWTDLKRHIG